MPDGQHTGIFMDSLLAPDTDSRVDEAFDTISQVVPLLSAVHDFTADPFNALTLHLLDFGRTSPELQVGKVVQALPGVNWYRVQLAKANGDIGCCLLNGTSVLPIGPRRTGPIPTNSKVLVFKPEDLRYGIILGTIPEQLTDAKLACPDYIQHDGTTGFKREPAHHEILRLCRLGGGVMDFSSNSPVDSTSLDHGIITETGVGYHVDSFQTFMRVSEICGLFLNYLDNYARLAGWNLDFQTAASNVWVRDDEAETQFMEGHVVYPWELLGSLTPDDITKFHESDDIDVQYDSPYSKFDLREESAKLIPFLRAKRWAGYLGQGGRRTISIPVTSSSTDQKLSDDPPLTEKGVFDESVSLDGGYSLAAARSVSISKRLLLPIPHQKRKPEDPKGDNRSNYKASGKYGSGDDHKVSAFPSNGGDIIASLKDYHEYLFNWQNIHPFHYHKNDYKLFDGGESTDDVVQASLNFDDLQSKSDMDSLDPVTHKVDDRYGEVEYFENESYFDLLPDGSVVIGDGYGSEIRMSKGNIDITCPGDVRLLPGRSVVCWSGDDLILKARNSIDLTSSSKDVRLKAEGNMQILGGNGGKGGVLLESKATDRTHQYKGKIGEEVISSGIVLKADSSQVVALGADLYFRSLQRNITLDANKASGSLVFYGNSIERHATTSMVDNFGASGEKASIRATNVWSADSATIDSPLSVIGFTAIANGGSGAGLIIDGGINLINGGQAAAEEAQQFGRMRNEDRDRVREAVKRLVEQTDQQVDQSKDRFDSEIKDTFYEENKVGNDTLINQLQFSLRDDEGKQYRTESFSLIETRWQQLVRTGASIGSSATSWQESAVSYDNKQLYPYPGNAAKSAALRRLQNFILFDPNTGNPKPRNNESYLDPSPDTLQTASLDEYLTFGS